MKVYFHGSRVEAMELIICCKRAIMRFLQLHILLFSCFCLQKSSTARRDSITHAQPIADPQSIISSNGAFELGFFSPVNTTNRFVGTWWHSNISAKTVVWVANRNRPLTDSSGTISISEEGNLAVLNGQQETIWSSNVSISTATSAQLLDSGNLVLQDNSSGKTIWESFRDPSNSFLEKMTISSDVNTGHKTLLKSWKSPSDPSIGSFYLGINPLPVPEVFVWKDGSPYWRTGPWNRQIFIGIPDMVSLYLNSFNLVDDKEGAVYLTFTLADKSLPIYLMLNYNGTLMQKDWIEEQQEWEVTWLAPSTDCEVYGKCGPFGICNSKGLPICSCLKGFEPKRVEEWNRGNFSSGCVRTIQLQCERNSSSSQSKKDGFLKLTMVKAPAFEEWSAAQQDDCEAQCIKNCSCTAYAYNSGIGCMLWSGGLFDIQKFSRGGVDLYIRVANSELGKNRDIKVIVIPVIIGSIAIVIFGCLLYARMVKQKGKNYVNRLLFKKFSTSPEHSTEFMLDENVSQDKLEELPLFKFEELTIATKNFHETNKLGQGGFGLVYKGKLLDGREIAVKRLSRSSEQGLQEFMNEVMVMSKLQHRNLVRLFGCCVEREQKMLIYEYMPNKSLDAFLFDSQKQKLLDWTKRFKIIKGIGRGLLYLHRDSRLRIIHRDLKASNILLDEGLSPKISDFGLARIFGTNEDEANTRRVVGTYGYMAPEYAMEGQFSEKSDVFAFGVLLLELVSGRRNTSFYNDEQFSNLLGYAWKLWNEDKVVELIDSGIVSQGSQIEMLRCIHVGLLCVQEFARERPTISMVLSMLSSEIARLPLPKQPAFTQPTLSPQTQSAGQNPEGCSTNECSITIMEAR